MLLAASGGLLAGLGVSPLLQISEVIVEAPPGDLGPEVASLLNIPPGASNLFYSQNRISRQVRACPRVKAVTMRRDSPNRLIVTITAYEPLIVMEDETGYTLVSREGICLQRHTQRPAHLPLFRGLTAPQPPLGSRVDPPLMEHVWEVLQGATKGEIREGLKADFTSRSNIILHTAGGTRAELGNVNHLARKTAILGRLIKELSAADKPPRQVDLSIPESPVWTPG